MARLEAEVDQYRSLYVREADDLAHENDCLTPVPQY